MHDNMEVLFYLDWLNFAQFNLFDAISTSSYKENTNNKLTSRAETYSLLNVCPHAYQSWALLLSKITFRL